ncbi:MAG TPA: cyclase family protein [Gemmatimonadales bacterium]|nr:cyclase family protein [Gemmatimonadales bacterium]
MRHDEWIDITVPIRTGMVRWPGDPEVRVDRVQDLHRGDSCNVSRLVLGTHTGTHMDPPLHYLADGEGLDRMPLSVGIGPARVIDILDTHAITPHELLGCEIQPGERILFKTQNSARCWKTDRFVEDFVALSRPAAEYLATTGVLLVGVDYLSVGPFRDDGAEVHRILLAAGIWIVEGLDLSRVRPGHYELVCLPLRIADADGAPARAALRKR